MEVENRGGPNGGPQYNPMNISAVGGAGQSGKKAQKAMQLRPSGGGAFGATKAQVEQIKGAEGVVGTAPAAVASLAELTRLSAPTNYPDMPVSSGGRLGDGNGEEALMLPPAPDIADRYDSGIQAIRAMYLRDPNNEDLRRMLEYSDGVNSEGFNL